LRLNNGNHAYSCAHGDDRKKPKQSHVRGCVNATAMPVNFCRQVAATVSVVFLLRSFYVVIIEKKTGGLQRNLRAEKKNA